jgi:predicted HTH transcriptional regulator
VKTVRTTDYLQSLVSELSKLSSEVEWVEFKCNNKDPERIAKYISGLSNSAALMEKPKGYLIWGIDDITHNIVGTTFDYRNTKKGNEELEAWLARMITPRINFKFYEVEMDKGVKVVIIEIPCAENEPTRYGAASYIRVGSNLKPLVDYKDKEAELWRLFDTTPYELRTAASNMQEDDVVYALDYSKYYEKLELPIPRNREKVLNDLVNEKFLRKNDAGNWDITNLGALMISKDLKKFDKLSRRTVRVVWYKNHTRLETIREKEFNAGYILSYEDIIQYIMTIIPQEEVIVDGVRKSIISFPPIAIRELLANTMVHQSLEQRGTNPMVEIFSDRIEFSNAGAPLVAIDRILDTVPVSRNENMAGFMHKCGICEERGSGFDKVVDATSRNTLLAPKIENQNNQFTKVVLFSKIPFKLTSKEDRVRTCYMQACLAYVNFDTITNADIRKLFDLSENDKVKGSRIIKDTLEMGLIKPVDPETAPRYMKYIPYWA